MYSQLFPSTWRNPLLLMMAGLPLACYAASSPTTVQIKQALERSHILEPHCRVHASMRGSQMTVVTYRNPKADDKDIKIEAVLIAKRVIDLNPAITEVITRFYDSGASCLFWQAEVKSSDIAAFKNHQDDYEKLLAGLPLTDSRTKVGMTSNQDYGKLIANYEVVPGCQQPERAWLLERLLKIEQLGGNPEWGPFLAIEDAARLGESESVMPRLRVLGARAQAELAKLEEPGQVSQLK